MEMRRITRRATMKIANRARTRPTMANAGRPTSGSIAGSARLSMAVLIRSGTKASRTRVIKRAKMETPSTHA